MADEDNEGQPAEEASGGMMKKLMFGGIGMILLAAGIFAGPAVMNIVSPPEETEDAGAPEPSDGPPMYTSLHPPLVINFKDEVGDAHFMQITMEVMARDQSIINAVREHTPVIRNNLILLYGNSRYEVVTTREGKEQMLSDGLTEIQNVLTEQIGEPGVEALYFTALVIQ